MSRYDAMKSTKSDRRDFIKAGGVAVAAILAQGAITETARGTPVAATPSNPKTPDTMPTRNLGKTGYRVGIFSLGGQGALEVGNNDAEAVPIVEKALDLGVNYLDTSSIYGGPDRWSERYIGQVMKTRRAEAFLASKTKERTREGSMRMLEQSFKLLQTDHLDLWQLHDVGTLQDVEEIFAKGGAMEALQQAHDQKLVRYLGITGHHRPDALMELIRRFPFDTVLLALNAADKHHFSFMESLLPMAVEKQMGIIGMKIPARGRILSAWTPPPIEKQQHSWEGSGAIAKTPGTLTMREAMYYTLTLPVSTVIIGCNSVAQLEENVQLARQFTPLSESQMAALSEKAKPVAQQALFFRFLKRA
jgi:aryl-alcohol dehydrogenase-like predicted oxidoreductase